MAEKKLRIQDAVKRPGALSKKAAAANMTVLQYARKHKDDKGLTGYQARFYLNTLRPINQRRKNG